jgi:hypothetical protein
MSKARDLANAGTALTSVSATELGYLDGVTSAVQTQLDTKLASSTAATTYQAINANVSTTELGYLDGVTSAIQTQLNQKSEYAAGKNKIINGDFGVWQRGTSYSNPGNGTFTADRFVFIYDGSGSTRTLSRQTFTPGAAPVAGYEGSFFWRNATTVAGTGGNYQVLAQLIEDVRTFAGQTITFSFWAKADASRSITANVIQNFGSGGSSEVFVGSFTSTVSTSWARYSGTMTMPSLSGKTIGTSSFIKVEIGMPLNTAMTIDTWGWQFEAGSVATPFQTATGTVQGELAACQRYYVRYTCESGAPYAVFATSGNTDSSTSAICYTSLPVQLRIYPVSIEYGGSLLVQGTGAGAAVTSIALQDRTNTKVLSITYTVASGLTGGQYAFVRANNSSTAYLGVSAEF